MNDVQYSKLISVAYQKADKGFVAKQLYCPICGEELLGTQSNVYEYECSNCEFALVGDEAEDLYLLFVSDVI